jgi:hypothetical protein
MLPGFGKLRHISGIFTVTLCDIAHWFFKERLITNGLYSPYALIFPARTALFSMTRRPCIFYFLMVLACAYAVPEDISTLEKFKGKAE